MNEFAAIGVGLSGLNAAREELDVTGNNIANATTPGYVRERADVVPHGPATPTLLMPSNGVGQGVTVLGVSRLNDSYADAQSLAAQAGNAAASQTESVLSQVQAAFNEPGTDGISGQMAAFWSQWDVVANNPTDQAASATLISKAGALASTFNQTAAALSQVKAGAGSGAMTAVAQINQDATEVAQLNSEIVAAQAGGSNASGLADQRDTVVNQLSQLVGAQSRVGPNGSIDVLVGSEMLVNGVNASTVTGTLSASGNTLTLTWPDRSNVAAGGQLGVFAQSVNTTIPQYESSLDSAATALMTTVNTQLAAGVSWTGVGTPSQSSQPGQPLFVGTGAALMAVSPTMTPTGLAAGSPSLGPSDGSNAQKIAELASSPGGADALYRGLVGQIGTDLNTAMTQSSTTATIQSQAEAQRQSSEGVNLDEELAQMTQFQNAYSASAKFLTTVDQTIQTLLAMTG